MISRLSMLFALICLAGCANQEIQRKDGSKTARPYAIENLAKSDVDMITEITEREVLRSLRLLTEKLYRRNPQEYRKAGLDSPEAATARIFEQVGKGAQSPLALVNWQEHFALAFQESYPGDRVQVFMSSLTSMLMATYHHKMEFFLTDELDAQKFYNSARNVETVVWKLSNARLANGERMLLTNSMDGEAQNLSFEREFGKIIAQQDLLALIMEERSNRAINRGLQGTATFVLLPI